jgi:putative Ca2+/H+ antiporter (TMEM165/GDT1 family)
MPLQAFTASFLFVLLAEMGDKTQLLAMALASRFRWQIVLWGIFWATAVNHGLAVLVGKYLTVFVPLDAIRVAAATSFVLFGLWTVRGDRLEGEESRFSFSPFWTVFAAFFVAETGDKTQLATIALAADYASVWPVWLGTTSAMVVADAFGIVVGVVLGKRLPERTIKWVSALVFIGFGLWGLAEALPAETARIVVPAVTAAAGAALILLTRRREG